MATEASGGDIWSETDTSVVDTNQKDLEHGGNMADILRGLQASLTRLATQGPRKTDNWGGTYSYIRVHRL